MDSLVRERNGVDEIWYSEEYLISQIKLAFRAGLHKGIKVDFHSVEPRDEKMVKELVKHFKKLIDDEYHMAYSKSEVLKITK